MGLIHDIVEAKSFGGRATYKASAYYEGDLFQERYFETEHEAKAWVASLKRQAKSAHQFEFEIKRVL